MPRLPKSTRNRLENLRKGRERKRKRLLEEAARADSGNANAVEENSSAAVKKRRSTSPLVNKKPAVGWTSLQQPGLATSSCTNRDTSAPAVTCKVKLEHSDIPCPPQHPNHSETPPQAGNPKCQCAELSQANADAITAYIAKKVALAVITAERQNWEACAEPDDDGDIASVIAKKTVLYIREAKIGESEKMKAN